jgi:hypothetical protein
MHGNAAAGANVAVNLNRFGGVAVLLGHKPTGLVGADWYEGEIGSPKAVSDFDEQPLVETGVTDKVEVG